MSSQGLPVLPESDATISVTKMSPPELAAVANRAHAKTRAAGQSMIAYAVEAGEALTAAKALIPHGQWLAWLEANFDGSQ